MTENSCQHCHIWRLHFKLATVWCMVIILNPHRRNQAFSTYCTSFLLNFHRMLRIPDFLCLPPPQEKKRRKYIRSIYKCVFCFLFFFFFFSCSTLSPLQESEYAVVCAHGKGIDKRYIGLISAEMLMDLLINKFIRPSGSSWDKGNLSKRVKWELKHWANKLGHKLCLYGLKSASRATWIHILDYWFA